MIAGDRRRRGRLLLAVLALAAAGAALLSLGLGASEVHLGAVPRVIAGLAGGDTGPDFARERLVLIDIRLPRTLCGLLVGAGLGLSGALLQGLFRNPLADPGLIGISSGAALGAVLALGTGIPALFLPLGRWTVPACAFAGGMLTVLLLYAISTRGGRTSIATLLLAGVAISALAGAVTGFVVFISDDTQLRDITFWSLGSLAGGSWHGVGLLLPFLGLSFVLAPFLARSLNALLLGEADALALGIRVERAKRLIMVAAAAAVGASVALCGVIGFVGVVVPHLVRLAAGPDHRILLPASALLGAALLVGADLAARIAAIPAEVPIGIVTAAMGAPFFLWLLLRRPS